MSDLPIPHIKFSDGGSAIHFSHANGYPPLCYKALLSPFEIDHTVIARASSSVRTRFIALSSLGMMFRGYCLNWEIRSL